MEDGGVGVVQVPLVGVEAGHDDLAVLQLGKAARRGGGEHLGNGLLKLPGDVPAVVEEVTVPVPRLASPGFFGPLMVLAGVVHHKVQAQADPRPAAGVGQRLQVLHGAQLGLDRAEIADGVAPVAAPLGGLQQGHQVEVVHSALLDVLQPALYAVQVSGEGVHIEHHPQQVPAAVPVGVGLPRIVLVPERLLPLVPAPVQHPAKTGKRLLVVVEFLIQPLQFLTMPAEAAAEGSVPKFHPCFLPRFRTDSRFGILYHSPRPTRKGQIPRRTRRGPSKRRKTAHRDISFRPYAPVRSPQNLFFTFCTKRNPCSYADSMNFLETYQNVAPKCTGNVIGDI